MEYKSKYIKHFYYLIALSKLNEKEIFDEMLYDVHDVFITHADDKVKIDKENYVFICISNDTKKETKLHIYEWLNMKFDFFYKGYTKELSSELKQSINIHYNSKLIDNSSHLIYGKIGEVRNIKLQKKWINKFDDYFDYINNNYLPASYRSHAFCFPPSITKKLRSLYDDEVGEFIHKQTNVEDFINYFKGYLPNGNIYFTSNAKFIYHFIKELALKANVSKHWSLIGKQQKMYFVNGNETKIIDQKFVHSSPLSIEDKQRLKNVMEYFKNPT